jgi:polyisoprenoid-binding protein YceI
MNKLLILLLSAGFLFFSSCSKAPEGEKTETTEAQEVKESTESANTLTIDTDQSAVLWTGSKATGQHNGIIPGVSGSFMLDANNNVTGGSFEIEMSTLEDKDLSPEDGKEKLEGHLKSEDFFHVEKHPTAKFEITEVKAVEAEGYNHMISGNLTMKDSTNNISFPAMVNMKDGMITASTPQFTINRTKWGVLYGSGVIGTIKDKLINDEVGIQLNIVAGQN